MYTCHLKYLIGLLLYSGAVGGDVGVRDFLALGLVDSTPVFKLNLGSGAEELSSSATIPLDQPSTIKIIRDKKDGQQQFTVHSSQF